jgi:hypothetical protein
MRHIPYGHENGPFVRSLGRQRAKRWRVQHSVSGKVWYSSMTAGDARRHPGPIRQAPRLPSVAS